MIPRVFHQIWLGGNPMPPQFKRWGSQWAALHPGWTFYLWQQGDRLDVLRSGMGEMTGHLAPLTTACHLSQRSNIWRYDLIEYFGGVYLDTDMEPVRNIEPLIEHLDAFAGGLVVAGQQRICPAIFGAEPGHEWLRDLVSGLSRCDPAVKGSMGGRYFGAITRQHPEVTVFDQRAFYSGPIPGSPADMQRPLAEDVFAVHHWSSAWFPDSFRPLATA